jgi:hypothetical protein
VPSFTTPIFIWLVVTASCGGAERLVVGAGHADEGLLETLQR